MIGVTRRIVDSMLLQNKHTHLTHEVLCTLIAEISAIINVRPLIPISSDPSSPIPLSPAMLLTQKPGLHATPGNFTSKVEVRTASQGTSKTYLRPVSDIILLLEDD